MIGGDEEGVSVDDRLESPAPLSPLISPTAPPPHPTPPLQPWVVCTTEPDEFAADHGIKRSDLKPGLPPTPPLPPLFPPKPYPRPLPTPYPYPSHPRLNSKQRPSGKCRSMRARSSVLKDIALKAAHFPPHSPPTISPPFAPHFCPTCHTPHSIPIRAIPQPFLMCRAGTPEWECEVFA